MGTNDRQIYTSVCTMECGEIKVLPENTQINCFVYDHISTKSDVYQLCYSCPECGTGMTKIVEVRTADLYRAIGSPIVIFTMSTDTIVGMFRNDIPTEGVMTEHFSNQLEATLSPGDISWMQ